MKFANRLKFTVSGTNAATLSNPIAVNNFRTVAQAIAAGDLTVGDTGVPFVSEDASGNWEQSYFTITSATVLTRQTIEASSNGGAAATFTGPITVFCTPFANYLSGTSLPDYLAANDGGTPQNTDLVPIGRGTSLLSVPLTALASAINKLLPSVAESQVAISSTNSLVLDFTTHNRRRIVCTATPSSINGPASFASVGNGFACKVENLSGNDIPLSGITARPSGTVIPAGGSAEIYATGGALYANVTNIAQISNAVAPGQVTGLAAGTSTDVTQALTWTAPSTGTAPFTYKVEYKPTSGSTWTQATASANTTAYTVTGLTANTGYDYRVTASNSAGPGTVSATVSKTTAAAAGAVSTPYTVSARANFPVTRGTSGAYGDNNIWITDIVGATSANITGVTYYLSTSNSVHPTDSISDATTPRGAHAVANLGSAWYVNGLAVGTDGNYYFWMKVVDNLGTYWYMIPVAIQFGSAVPNTYSSSVTQIPAVA